MHEYEPLNKVTLSTKKMKIWQHLSLIVRMCIFIIICLVDSHVPP